MRTILIALSLIFALTVTGWADYADDMKEASAFAKAGENAKARAAYQAIAQREKKAERKKSALILAAAQLAKDGKVDESLAELLAMQSVNAKVVWVSVALVNKNMNTQQVEPILSQIPAGTSLGNSRFYLAQAYLKEGQGAKAKQNIQIMASESPNLIGLILPALTKKSLDVFSSKDEQIAFYNGLLRVIPAVDANAKTLGLIKSQIELLK